MDKGVMDMTSKLSWIFFIPFSIAAVFFKLAQTILPDGSIFGLTDLMLDYVSLGCAVLTLVFTLVVCIIDRKISPYYQPHRNIPAGVLGLLLAVVCAADGANGIYLALSSGKADALAIIESVLLLLASVVFIVMGLTHSFMNRDSKSFAIFNVMPALLCAVRLISGFIGITTISITQADITLLFSYAFGTLFFFNYAVTVAMTEAKHAVKSCFIFGFASAAMLFARGISAAVEGFNTADLFANAEMVELILMAAYITAFLIELTLFAKDKDHVIVLSGDSEEQEDDGDEEEDKNADNFVVTGVEDESRDEPENGYLNSADIEGYLYQVVQNPELDDTVDQSDPDAYITHVVKLPENNDTPYMTTEEEDAAEKAVETKAAPSQPAQPSPAEPVDYDRRLDEIDKLILELTKDTND